MPKDSVSYDISAVTLSIRFMSATTVLARSCSVLLGSFPMIVKGKEDSKDGCDAFLFASIAQQ